MDYSRRHLELKSVFRLGTDIHLEETNIDIRFFPFRSSSPNAVNGIAGDDLSGGDSVPENDTFVYPVFVPSGKASQTDKAILLLHGLNERNWTKYLTWAEYLCSETGRAVILFPLAYHINRSPWWWADPRQLVGAINLRRKNCDDDRTVSFANVALSNRLSEKPHRFYLSGRQTFADLTELAGEIREGRHPAFGKDTGIDIFSYSIGAFLSQILLMANPRQLFSDTKLFMFCGGSIFSSMFGVSKTIMDRESFRRIYDYYIHSFGRNDAPLWQHDDAFESFYSMISPERKQEERLSFFAGLGRRIGGISLARDIVIPYSGVKEALGSDCAESRISCMDFDTGYSHENPFPIKGKDSDGAVNSSFRQVFSAAASFLM